MHKIGKATDGSIPRRSMIFFFLRRVHINSGVHSHPYPLGSGGSIREVKLLESESNHSI
jgi:hypothetical protein